MDKAYKTRLESTIKSCDYIGMIVIVCLLYEVQLYLLDDEIAIMLAMCPACEF